MLDLGTRHQARGTRNTAAELVQILRANIDVTDPRREARAIVQLASDPRAARAAAERRACGMPLAYAIGRAAFRHLVLDVDERVLIPRPETEIVVDEALSRCRTGVAIDVGTGSGAIAISLATEGDFERVIGIDVSSDALAVARSNAGDVANVEFRPGSYLVPARDVRANLIVSNPPYISAAEMRLLPPAVRDWEPPLALSGGEDGLEPSRRIVAEAPGVLMPGGWLVLETDCTRAGTLGEIISCHGAYESVSVRDDLTGRKRAVSARRL